VEIAPGAEAAHRAAVFVGDVEAARERDLAVDDDDLPVVSEVDRLKEQRAIGKNRANLPPAARSGCPQRGGRPKQPKPSPRRRTSTPRRAAATRRSRNQRPVSSSRIK